MAGRRHGAAALVLCAALLLARLDAEGATTGKDVWAEKWCELNDCYGIREAEQRQGALAKVEREHRKATRRYRATGEIKALNSEAVATAWFGYDGPTLDHPAFPGVAAEHAERAERAHEEHALGVRKVVQQRTIAPPQPGGGYLLPDSSEATQLAVREQDDSAIGVARRRHGVMKEQLRMDCMYGYAQESDGNGGFVYGGGRTTVPKAPKGCAAGSVWQDDGRGGVNLVSRTAEAAGSVWRKVNGTDREWWEDVEPVPKNVPWVQSWKQYRSAQLIPYKQRAPPPCSPGYGGAFCKKELGTGGDYVDEEDVPPPWANMGDVQRLKQFWKEQYALATGKTLSGVNLQKHQAGALPLEPGAFSAGTAERNAESPGRDDCSCDPLDFKCILRCTSQAMIMPKKCYEKCDSTMCHQECVHVDITFDQQPKGVGGKGKPKEKKEETPATQALGAGKESLQQRQSIGGSTQADTDGTHSETSAVNDCEPGSFSVSGQKPCEPCAAGSYMPNSAARSCIRCAQGTFQNATGATACDSCGGDESSTTSGAGATSAKDCGNFPAVTGIQYMKYENQADETMTTLDGHTAVGDDSDWKPTLYGGALGPWFGGWWIAVYGKNLGKSQADLLDVRIGDLACRKSVWLSSTSSACMVPRGMGWNLPVTVELAGGQQAAVESKFSYEAPVVDSYHPRNGPPRGGFWVTIAGRNFGHLDTSPTASVGGRICLETYWMSNTQILCRGPPGVGGPSMLHHVDITFESAEHVQEMPRRLRNWVRSVLHKAGHSVSAKQNASKPVVEIDLKAANDPASSALVAKGDKSADKGKKAKPKKANTATSLAEMKQEWTEREQEVKAELSEVKASAREAELELLATYLERVEERDKEREEQEQAEKARRLAEYQAVLDAERKIREEEEAAAQARQKQEEMRKAIDKGTVEKKLDKFTKAREAARKKKLLGDANAALALTKSCTDLVELDCKTGNCKLITAPALASAACVVADLEKAANITRAAGMQETEAAKKAVALVFEIQTGLETGNKFLKNAEASVAKLAGKEGVQVETDGKAAKDVLGKARAAFQSAGVSGKNGLASVDALQVKVDDMLEQVARKAEAEREKHAQEGAAAVAKARLKMEEAQFVEARAAHGTAVVEYEMAGLKEKMALELAALLEKIGEAEEVATVRDAKAAALKRKELEEEEQRIAAEKERVRLEEEAKKAAEEEQRLKQLAEQERREEEEERKKKEAEEKKAREKREREEAEARRKREQEDKEKREREAEALRAAETKLQEEATAAAPGGDGASAGNLSDVCSSVGGVQTCSKPSPTASSPSPPPSDSATGPATDKAGEVPATESAAAAKAAADKMAADKAAAHEAAAKAAAEQKAAAEAPSKLAASSAAGQAPAAEKKAGLGMGVKPVMDAGKVQTGLQVSKLVPTGAAAESGNVNEGDLLQAVDGVDVRLWPLKKLANEKILGQAGTEVVLTLKSPSGAVKEVKLVRR